MAEHLVSVWQLRQCEPNSSQAPQFHLFVRGMAVHQPILAPLAFLAKVQLAGGVFLELKGLVTSPSIAYPPENEHH